MRDAAGGDPRVAGGPPIAALRGVPARRVFAALVAAALMTASGKAGGQCANRPSSCLQCHETEGHYMVRGNGTDWHRDHALGDFCAGCHGGDADAPDAAGAHRGVAWPLADPQRSCAPCHEGSFRDLAARYAVAAEARHARRGGGPPLAEPARPRLRTHDAAAGTIAALLAAAAAAIVTFTERRRPARGGSS
jgi:hypothetical protein